MEIVVDIDRDLYPDRFKIVCDEIEKRKIESKQLDSTIESNKRNYFKKQNTSYSEYFVKTLDSEFINRLKIKNENNTLIITKSISAYLFQLPFFLDFFHFTIIYVN